MGLILPFSLPPACELGGLLMLDPPFDKVYELGSIIDRSGV
jgi:hypothetical protein